MQEEKYIPGFDWVRIIGPLLVVLSHYGVFDGFVTSHSYASMFKALVPVFFIMSGYLSGRSFSRERIWKKVVKYCLVYMLMGVCAQLYMHLADVPVNGYFSYTGFFVNSVKCLVTPAGITYQLWFIPCLLYPTLLNACLDGKSRRYVIAAAALLSVLFTAIGKDAVVAFYEKVTDAMPILLKVTSPTEMRIVTTRYVSGFLFTTIGFALASTELRPSRLLLVLIPAAAFELGVFDLGVTSIVLPLLVFYIVKRLPGRFLYPYHRQISLFALTMFFLHLTEKQLVIRFITENIFWNLVIITAVNLLITIVFSGNNKKRAGEPVAAAPEET